MSSFMALSNGSRRSAQLLTAATLPLTRPFNATTFRASCRLKHDKATTSHPPKASGQQEGEAAQTDSSEKFKYPGDDGMPPGKPVQGQGGTHHKPTLPSFSLQGKVAVITGGARGLGLVMAQGLMRSGAQVALVDLNGVVF
jgi:hypothetical protein